MTQILPNEGKFPARKELRICTILKMGLQGRDALWNQGGDGEAICAWKCSKAIIIPKIAEKKLKTVLEIT
jgi:hypothetical protein